MKTMEAPGLVLWNDPLLESLVRAETEAACDREIERLMVVIVQPLAERIVSRYTRSEGMISRVDAEDIIATVNLRVVRKLRAITESEEEQVRQLTEYVATLTYNTINDHLRRRHPERTRVSNRLRYVLTHDARLALWTSDAGVTGGLASERGSTDALTASPLERADATLRMLDSTRPADALVEIFQLIERPLLFGALVNCVAMLWRVNDAPPSSIDDLHEHRASADFVGFESREFLQALWREVRLLPPQQRKALLLNLRDADTPNVMSLLVFTGTAKFDDIAAMMEMTIESLSALWNDLPLDDLRIAGLLNMTRQKVINLRKAARERLGRRLYRAKR